MKFTLLLLDQEGSFRLAGPATEFPDFFPDLKVSSGPGIFSVQKRSQCSCLALSTTVWQLRLASSRASLLSSDIFCQKVRRARLGGHSTFLVPPLGGMLVYSPGPGSSLGYIGIGCFENHVPNVLKVSVDTCIRRVNCIALVV